jgi:Tol biopolymer transport system component
MSLLGSVASINAQSHPADLGGGPTRDPFTWRNPPGAASVLRVNLNTVFQEVAGTTDAAALSDDGVWVAFSSVAANIVGDDGSGLRDVFLRNVATGEVLLVSHDASGLPANGASGATLDLSADGRYVTFDSWASNLVPGDVIGTLDIFVYDRVTALLSLVSKSSAGVAGNAASAEVSISADGRHVAFSSWADNLVPGDINGLQDVFVHDNQTAITWRVSEDVSGMGGEGPSHSPDISATGQFIAYSTRANNLVADPLSLYHYIFVHDAATGETWHASKNTLGDHAWGDSDTRPAISADGRYVAFASHAYNLAMPDLNWVSDIFVHDHVTGITTRVSVASDGSEGSGASIQPTISADGSIVAFTSGASELTSDDTNAAPDVFVHDLGSALTWCVSRAVHGGVANAASDTPSLSADGQALLFASQASNLVLADGNGVRDVFTRALP